MTVDLGGNRVEAIGLGISQQVRGAGCGRGQIQADQGVAALDERHVLQSGAIMGAAVKRIDSIKIPKTCPLQYATYWDCGRSHLSHDLPSF